MISRKQWFKLGLLLAAATVIAVFSCFPVRVEDWYATGIYPAIASTMRILLGQVPFSIGDIIYVCIVLRLLIRLVRVILLFIRKQHTKERTAQFLYRYTAVILWIYIIFKVCWGLNYDRQGIAWQLKLDKQAYTREDITNLTNQLIDKVNASRRELTDTALRKPPLDSIYQDAYRSYQVVSLEFDFLNYRNSSVKSSLFSAAGDYMGFSGYYNPFTGEAQLRTDIPRVLIPYIACHEMAHQLGYASESEANFVGYLAGSSSPDAYTRYSVYLDLFSYAQGEEISFYGREKNFKSFDSVIRQNRARLDTLVKKDRREIREFFYKRKNRISPAVSGMYDQYLKLNSQAAGIKSYNEVIGWLIAFQKKYGRL